MPREKPAYRDNLERLDEAFPGKEMLTQSDVCRFTGRNHQTVKKYWGHLFKKGVAISKAVLARELS